jgi:hypothetical protein
MTSMDIARNGKRAPETLFTWESDGFAFRAIKAHYPAEFRGEKKKLASKNWSPCFWTKSLSRLQGWMKENGL